MIIIKFVDFICHLVSEFIYMTLYLFAVACRFMFEYRYAIATFILLGIITLGGFFGYCIRMAQIYGV